MQRQCDGFVAAVMALGKLELGTAIAVTRELANGPWTHEQRVAMADALATAQSMVPIGGGPRCNQDCKSFEDF